MRLLRAAGHTVEAFASAREFQLLTGAVRPGDVLALYLYLPDEDQRALRTIRIDQP